jgi:hypothetical protein
MITVAAPPQGSSGSRAAAIARPLIAPAPERASPLQRQMILVDNPAELYGY